VICSFIVHFMSRTLKDRPSLNLLQEIVLDHQRDLPLHAQLRTALARLIHNHFEDESYFFSEAQLIEHLHVSQGTVRRALADLAADGTIEKRPARGTIVRKCLQPKGLQNLAVFLPDYSSPNVARFMTLLNSECLNRNINLLPIYTHRGEMLLRAYSSLKFEPREGSVVLLANSSHANTELTCALRDKGYECVSVDTLVRDSSDKYVGVCNQSLIQMGMDHLVELGHRRIVLLVNEPEENENIQERIDAFEQYTRERGDLLETSVVRAGTLLWEDASASAERMMRNVLELPTRPTAIFTTSDIGALAVIRWLQQQGMCVPKDISVLGADGIEMGTMIHPALTTVAQPFNEITAAVFELLLSPEPKTRKLFLKPSLIVRESTSAPQPII
jgi:LacI family transcriptional regulator